MTLRTRWPSQAIAVPLIVAAGLFVIGVTSEKFGACPGRLAVRPEARRP